MKGDIYTHTETAELQLNSSKTNQNNAMMYLVRLIAEQDAMEHHKIYRGADK